MSTASATTAADEPALARQPTRFGTTHDAAGILLCSEGHLRRLVGLNLVPHYKPFGPAGATRFDLDEIETWIRRSRVGPASEEK